jgi:hypothetical protein
LTQHCQKRFRGIHKGHPFLFSTPARKRILHFAQGFRYDLVQNLRFPVKLQHSSYKSNYNLYIVRTLASSTDLSQSPPVVCNLFF